MQSTPLQPAQTGSRSLCPGSFWRSGMEPKIADRKSPSNCRRPVLFLSRARMGIRDAKDRLTDVDGFLRWAAAFLYRERRVADLPVFAVTRDRNTAPGVILIPAVAQLGDLPP